MTRRKWTRSFAALALVSAVSPLEAATKTWDLLSAGTNNGVINNGAGTWNTTTANWTSNGGTTNVTWASGDDAIFGGNPGAGAAGTITLAADQTANSVTFNDPASGSFTLSSNRISFGSGSKSITQSGNTAVVINSGIVGSDTNLTLGGSGSGTVTLNGLIEESSNGHSIDSVTKSGTSTFILNHTGNNYNGQTTINGGTLQINGALAAGTLNVATAGTLSGTGTVSSAATVTGNGIINFGSTGNITSTLGATGGTWSGLGSVAGVTTVSSGTFTVNGTMGGAGALNVSSGAKLAGTGTISKSVNINTGATLSPGGDGSNSNVGALATNAHTWGTTTTYLWEIKNATDGVGTAGVNYDTLNVTGALNVAATNANKMTIKITSYGVISNWNNLTNYHWEIASATSFTSFDANDFILDTTDFLDDHTAAPGYSFTIDSTAGKIRVNYVPEPASATLAAVGGIALLRRRRRQV